jgi:hypothetical protein
MNEIPTIVYKYRNWSDRYNKSVLLRNEIFMASAIEFNDPFDCRIPQNFSLLNVQEKDQYLTDQLIRLYPSVSKRNIDLEKKIHEIEKRFADTETYQVEHDKIEFEYFDKYFGVLSLSARWNSVLMWSHYADKHKGYCIGFYEERLRNSLFPTAVGTGIVKYQDNFPEIKPKVFKYPNDPEIIHRRFTETLTKSLDWTYEEEYRMFINYFPTIPNTEDRIVHFKDDIISEVIIGMNMNEPSKEEIINTCKSRKIPVYQAQKDKFKFEISKILI